MGLTTAVLTSGGAQIMGAKMEADAIRMEGEFKEFQLNYNADLAEMKAEDAIRQGDKQADIYQKQVNQMIGAQRANYAAQGVELDSGSAAQIAEDTAAQGASNILQLKNNAWREAWGYRVQATDLSFQGSVARLTGDTAARNTLVAGGLNAINQGASMAMSAGGGA